MRKSLSNYIHGIYIALIIIFYMAAFALMLGYLEGQDLTPFYVTAAVVFVFCFWVVPAFRGLNFLRRSRRPHIMFVLAICSLTYTITMAVRFDNMNIKRQHFLSIIAIMLPLSLAVADYRDRITYRIHSSFSKEKKTDKMKSMFTKFKGASK